MRRSTLSAATGNITAIGFASAMFQMSQSMFIFNVILSAIIGRSLASEIENKSIRLYINQIGIRKLIYGGKELALLIFSVFIDILLVLQTATFNGHQGHIIRPDRDIPGH